MSKEEYEQHERKLIEFCRCETAEEQKQKIEKIEAEIKYCEKMAEDDSTEYFMKACCLGHIRGCNIALELVRNQEF